MHTMNHFRGEFQRLGDSLSDGWHQLFARAEEALTHFSHSAPGDQDARVDVHRGKSVHPCASRTWGLLASDLGEDAEGYFVRLEVPGLDADDIDICMDRHELVISGHKQGRPDDTHGELLISECAYGRFQRRYPLQHEVLTTKATAAYRDGVLEVRLPKADPSLVRQIPINPG